MGHIFISGYKQIRLELWENIHMIKTVDLVTAIVTNMRADFGECLFKIAQQLSKIRIYLHTSSIHLKWPDQLANLLIRTEKITN